MSRAPEPRSATPPSATAGWLARAGIAAGPWQVLAWSAGPLAAALALLFGFDLWPPAVHAAALWPAHELHRPLALALALTGLAGAWPARAGPTAAARLLRMAATLGLGWAMLQSLAELARSGQPPDGPHIGALTGSCLMLALAILAVTLWPLPRLLADRVVIAVQVALALLWVLCTVALGALLPARLLLDWMPLDAGLSWPTTVVLTLLAAAGTARVYRQPALQAFFAEREDRRIFTGFLALLFGAIGVAALLIAGLLTVQVVRGVEPELHRGALTQARMLGQLIERVGAVADAAAPALWPDAFPGAIIPETAASTPPADDLADTTRRLQAMRRALDPLGQVGIRLEREGRAPLTEGRFDEGPWPRLPLSEAQRLALFEREGLVLQIEHGVPRHPGHGLTIQLRPFRGEPQLPQPDLQGNSAELLLCVSDGPQAAQCLSAARRETVRMPLAPREDGRLWPMQQAWRGQDGVMLLRDPARAAAAVAYAPVGHTGLGLAHKLMLAPLVRRLTADMPLALLMLFAVAAAGAGLLVRRGFPMLRDLRFAKAQVQATLEHLPRGVLTLDARERVHSSNAGAHALWGLDAQQLDGRAITDLLLPGEAGGDALWQPQAGTGEALLAHAGGERIPVEVLVERFDFEGAPRTVLIIRDLRREQARRAELAQWERLFFHAEFGVAVSNVERETLERLNPAFARMHGYTVDELVGRPVIDLFAPASRAELPDQLARVRAEGHARFESWHQRRDGSIFPVLIDATLVHDGEGRQPYRVVNVQDISEQRRAQEAVQRSEALLQLVLKSLPVGVWIADRDGRVVEVNPAVERLWRGPVALRDGRLAGHQARRVASGERIVDGDYPMQRAIRTGTASIGELIEIRCADDVWRTMMVAAVPLVDAEGRIQGAIAVHEDLTAVLRAEAAILAARNFFERLFQSAALGMAVWDGSGRFQRVNQALCELLGHDEATLRQLSLGDLAEPEQALADRCMLADMQQGASGKVELERRWRRGDGRWVWVLLGVSLVRWPDAPQAQFIVQVLDIDRTHRFQQALLASEARLLNAQRIARLGEWAWDPARQQLLFTEPARRMLGLPATHDGALTRAQWLTYVHPDDRDRAHGALDLAVQGWQTLAIDYRLAPAGGPERFLHQQAERDGDGMPMRLVGVLQDITERKQVENELLLSRQRLRALSANADELIEEERRHLAREVHDELGQALTALKMELALLGRRVGADPALAAQVERMGTMVGGTLDVVRHVVSNLRPSALDFGLVAAIEWLAEDFGLRWEMPCEVHLEGQEVALGDERATALFRIVQESLTNVARHAQAHRVDIHIASDGQRLHLSVRDDGIGFEPLGVQDRGTHFGLLGMRERALKIGARLHLTSHPGQGTQIDVELPLPAAPMPTPAPTPVPTEKS